MRTKNLLLYLLCMLSIHVHAQYPEDSISINIGDPAPPLYVQEWIKGSPIQQLEKGRIYVLEFWATWCRPCMAAMPHISALARKYHDKITFIGMDVYEQENTSVQKIKHVVDSLGDKMDYHVAMDDSNRMVEEWLVASGKKRTVYPGQLLWTPKGGWHGWDIPKISIRFWKK